uniref:SRS domain-containing protein n=1 Tax=Sarcocystis aucheniae TaxID=65407 RepID=A0A5P9S4P4_9APIC|nr:hypothetical protein [Sarcocystis aucheniae]
MTKAALLAFLTLCYARVSSAQGAAGEIPATCSGTDTVVTDVPKPATVVVSCPTEPAGLTLDPPAPNKNNSSDAKVYTGANESNSKSLSSVLEGATYYVGDSGKKILQVMQMPKSEVSVYLYCKKGGNDEKCVIQVKVAAASLLGPNTCAVPGTEISFSVQRPSERVQFSCGEGTTLQPNATDKALDSSCMQTISLPQGFSLQGTSEFELRVQELPTSRQELCYLCVSEDTRQSKKCRIRITAEGKGQGGSAKTLSGSARGAAALVLALVAASWLPVH